MFDEKNKETTSLLPPQEEHLSYSQAIWRTVKLSVPTFLSYTYSFNLVVLGVMGGRLGNEKDEENYLGATILASITMNTVVVLSISPFFAVAPHVKTQLGLGRAANVSAVLKHATLIALPIGLVAILPLVFSKEMLKAFGQNHDTVDLAATYLKPVALVVPASLLRLYTEQILFAFDKHTDVMKMALSSFTLGTVLSYMLCFGKFGAPKLGLPGLAYSLVIGEYVTALMFATYLHKHPSVKEFKFFQNFKTFVKNDLEQIKALLKIGFPISLTLLSELSASFLLTMFAGLLGKDQLAAYNLSAQVMISTTILPLAFGQTTMQQVSGAIASNQITNARRLAIAGVGSSLLLISPVCLAIMIDPTLLEKIFSNSEDVDNDVLKMAHQLAPIVACGVLADAVRFNILQVLRVTGDGNKATLSANLSVWIGVGFAYLLGNLTSLDIVGVVLGYELSALALGTATLLPRWYQRIKPAHLQVIHAELKENDKNITDLKSPTGSDDHLLINHSIQVSPSIPRRTRRNGACCVLV